jgi:hypothetical protein
MKYQCVGWIILALDVKLMKFGFFSADLVLLEEHPAGDSKSRPRSIARRAYLLWEKLNTCIKSTSGGIRLVLVKLDDLATRVSSER